MKVRVVPVRRHRGQPLLVFAMVLGGWLIVRVLLWQAPFGELPPARAAGEVLTVRPAAGDGPLTVQADAAPILDGPGEVPAVPHSLAPRVLPSRRLVASLPAGIAATLVQGTMGAVAADTVAAEVALPREVRRLGSGVSEAEAAFTRSQDNPPADLSAESRPRVPRWSGDAWLLLREDSAAPLAAGRPAYGRSQAGAVLRYRLAPPSGHRPVFYARGTRALAGVGEGEVAAGLAARPLPNVPVSVAAEVRVYDSAAGREVRPAAFAVTELPPAKLPFGLRGEAYVQAGYVGGRFATAFIDGQARVDGLVARRGEGAELRFGPAVWGGAQKHAERLDVGPGATVSFPLGEVRSRLALDYRFRIAGDAEPRSGPALTFSAGF